MGPGKVILILFFAFVGWALCGAAMGIGMALTSVDNAIIIHAIAAPVIFTILSLIYFKKFNYTTPSQTGAIFVGFIIFMDITVVAMMIEKSFDMFRSLPGTWIPFGLIFTSTYLTGSRTIKSE
jgi:hypothetical protein